MRLKITGLFVLVRQGLLGKNVNKIHVRIFVKMEVNILYNKLLVIYLFFAGTCRKGTKQVECDCPPMYSGRRCEIDVCKDDPMHKTCLKYCTKNNCANGGKCVLVNDQEMCKCIDAWGGSKCNVSIKKKNVQFMMGRPFYLI